MSAHVSNLFWIPLREGETHKPILTLQEKGRTTVALEPSEEDPAELVKVWRTEEAPEPIITYREKREQRIRYIGLPVDYGMENYQGEVLDRTSLGRDVRFLRCPNPDHPNAPKGQSQFFNDTLSAVENNFTCLGVADTGTGKTVSAMYCAYNLGVTTLAIVPSTRLAEQWKKEAMLHLGLEEDEIAMISGNKTDYEGCRFAIAIVHNLYQKEWTKNFSNYFGFVVWDECHRYATECFSESLTLFNATFKLALTATLKTTITGKVLTNYFGKPSVEAKAKPMPTVCFKKINDLSLTIPAWLFRCRNDVKVMKWLAGLKSRNQLIVSYIMRMYKDGRQVVVLSKFIDHLELLASMCEKAGLPSNVIGFYAGKVNGKKPKEDYFKKVKKESTVIFGTYSLMKEGVDIARLDGGIEALPVSNNIQGIGRVRRTLKGKRNPIWVSICDTGIDVLEKYSKNRLGGFKSKGITIKKLK